MCHGSWRARSSGSEPESSPRAPAARGSAATGGAETPGRHELGASSNPPVSVHFPRGTSVAIRSGERARPTSLGRRSSMKVDKIVVPLDGSTLAESALETAIDVADGAATLVLVRAAEAHHLPCVDATEAQVEVVREAEKYLEAVKARLTARGVERIETSVWYGSPASAIVDAARIRKADLIVMSTHGRSGLGRLILGSVAESVLRATSTPILLLRPQTPAWVKDAPMRETARV